MKKKAIISLCAVVVSSLPAVCHAWAAIPGGYASFSLGTSAPPDATVSISEFNPVSARSDQVRFDAGKAVGGAFGYDFGGIRMEGEMSYKQGEIASVVDQANGTRYVNADGHAGSFAMMLNGYYDLHNQSPVTPYVGGGMGFATVSLSDTRGVDAVRGTINNRIFSAADDNVLAYQAAAGVEVYLNRLFSVDLGYRYFGTASAQLRKDWPNSTEFKLASHNATVGLRVKF